MSEKMIATKPVKPVKNKVKELITKNGTWRIFDGEENPAMGRFREFKSHAHFMGRPLFGLAAGVNPDTGRLSCAEGIIAVGQQAKGIIAIGQIATGGVAIGQVAIARVFALGQVAIAPLAIGQLGLGVAVIGAIGFGGWGIFQIGAYVFGGIGMVTYDVLSPFLN